jgi:Iap family predicted aminopeptidase
MKCQRRSKKRKKKRQTTRKKVEIFHKTSEEKRRRRIGVSMRVEMMVKRMRAKKILTKFKTQQITSLEKKFLMKMSQKQNKSFKMT